MDQWTDKLSDYIDGELSSAEREALEAHLLQCAQCGETLQQLRAVVARAGQVLDRPPVNDLWTGIAARIAQPELPARRARSIAFSVPQLMAASVVLMLLSGGSMYLMLHGDKDAPVQQVAVATPAAHSTTSIPQPAARDSEPAPVASALPVSARRPAPVAVSTASESSYSTAINELEGALHTAHLDSTTVRVLEKNLRIIDKAIADARDALGNDPGNPYLNHYLDETMQKKIQILRRATGIARAST